MAIEIRQMVRSGNAAVKQRGLRSAKVPTFRFLIRRSGNADSPARHFAQGVELTGALALSDIAGDTLAPCKAGRYN